MERNVREFIRKFEVLILDMGNTIMFGGDRFDENQNFELTYRSFGGMTLSRRELDNIIRYVHDSLLDRSRNPAYFDNMLSVEEFVDCDESFRKLSETERNLIEKVFAAHECGTVPENIRKVLKGLSEKHRLGIISNVWCSSPYYREELRREGIDNLFDKIIFSSDHNSVKPSGKLFKLALSHFNKRPEEVVFIGDSYNRDVLGAKNAGIYSILINNGWRSQITGDVKPDFVINSIEDLVEC